MVQAAASAMPSQVSPHKRNRSNPFKILVSGHRPDPQVAEPRSPSKAAPKKHLTRSQTDTNLGTIRNDLPLGEILNEQRPSKQEHQPNASRGATLHKRTKSAISLKSLTGGSKPKESREEKENPLRSMPKKSKSSTNLAALFSRPKSRGRKDESVGDDHDKENASPSRVQQDYSPTPIWAQFAANRSEEVEQITSKACQQSISHERSPEKLKTRPQVETSNTNTMENRRGSRVQAAVAAFDGRSKDTLQQPISPVKQTPLDARAIESAFEALLETRNIPADVRARMRTMELRLKADFVGNNQHIGSPTKENEMHHNIASNPTGGSWARKNASPDSQMVDKNTKASSKKSRPRSFTLTTSKHDNDESPSKKARHGRSGSRSRPLSIELPRSWSSTSLVSQHSASSPSRNRAQKQTPPQDFITYFRKVTKPQNVEVGRVQKLRQLLRNETVAWVETFISDGGFEEVVALLHRIIEIEWREEHEDTLLHHTLNCLKALCTTSSGISYLSRAQAKLFPALLKLLFSSGEEKKGPSEFTTRELIIVLMFAYLQSSSDGTPGTRAKTLLSYLHDPEPSEAERPPAFLQGIHRSRPFKQWVTEISSVTREVFWIFLHYVNVIPFPNLDAAAPSYLAAHFPAARPPVAAAPYVGSIEWEATNYLATHIDLVNGLLASLPTGAERNALRTQLQDSGLEKVMGVSLRTCKEKFYGAVHAALSTWAGAADTDGWETRLVRQGPTSEEKQRKSPRKRRGDQEVEKPPMLGEIKVDEGPKLGVGLGLQVMNPDEGEGPRFLL